MFSCPGFRTCAIRSCSYMMQHGCAAENMHLLIQHLERLSGNYRSLQPFATFFSFIPLCFVQQSPIIVHYSAPALPLMVLLPTVQSPLISTGIWWDSSEPLYQSLIWTMTNTNALIILGALMVLGAYTQTRAWVLLRSLATQITTPIKLRAESDPIS